MSNSSTSVARERAAGVGERVDSSVLRNSLQMIAIPLRFVSFWVAIALPFLYLPLLYGGLSGQQAIVFVGLLALNGVALVTGHGYGQ